MTTVTRKILSMCVLGIPGFLNASEFPELPAFQDPPTGIHHPGQMIWADLFTEDVDGCAVFYTRLFGWDTKTLGAGRQSYTLFLNDGRPVAGMIRRPAAKDATTRGIWIPYFSVQALDPALEAATAAGAQIEVPVRDFPRRGRQAIIRDNQQALVGLMETSHGDPDDFLGGNGEWIWSQLWVRDPAASIAFYRSVLGFEEVERAPGETNTADHLWAANGIYRAGLGRIPDSMPDARSNWLGFIRIRNIEETLAGVITLGGRIWLEPRNDLKDGRLAVILDPAGSAVVVLEYASDLEEQP